MSEREERAVSRLGRIGFLSLAAVFAVIDWFLVKAAVQFDPHDAVSVGGALGRLTRLDYGQVPARARCGRALRVRPLRLRAGALAQGVRARVRSGRRASFTAEQVGARHRSGTRTEV
jgi:hypothetical protein